MVNVIENWCIIEGTVLSIKENMELPEYYIVEIQLDASSDVDTFPNLAKTDVGKIIFMNVRRTELESNHIALDAPIKCTARKSLKHVYFIK
jgi:hypothetical protein